MILSFYVTWFWPVLIDVWCEHIQQFKQTCRTLLMFAKAFVLAEQLLLDLVCIYLYKAAISWHC